jgi:hypothetical protein
LSTVFFSISAAQHALSADHFARFAAAEVQAVGLFAAFPLLGLLLYPAGFLAVQDGVKP